MPENNGNFSRYCLHKVVKEESVTSSGNPIYVREGVLYDTIGHITLSVWGDMMDTIEEDNLYCFTQVTLKNYFRKKLATL